MKKSTLIIGIIAFALIIIAAISMIQPVMRYYMEKQIDDANYCMQSEDCANAGTMCPFGCDILVNKAEVARIEKLMQSYPKYPEQCVYGCIEFKGAECIDNKCKPIIN